MKFAMNDRSGVHRALLAAVVSALTLFLFAPAAPAATGCPNNPPRCPTITSPATNSYVNRNSKISWKSHRGLSEYRVIITDDYQAPHIVDFTYKGSPGVSLYKYWNQINHLSEIKVVISNGEAMTSWDTFKIKPSPPDPPTLVSPGSTTSASNVPNRRPNFNWNAVSGAETYAVRVRGSNGQMKSYTNISDTSYQPPQNIPDFVQNPVKWSVTACTQAGGCGRYAPDFLINLAGEAIEGTVVLSQPSNGTNVDVGSQLTWQTKQGVATYKICLNMFNSGCRIIRDQAAQSGTIQTYTLTASDLDAKPPFGDYYFRGKTMYWSVGGCTQGNTACVGSAETRSVQVAAASTSGGSTGSGGDPQVSFEDHLYPTIASAACDSCHQSSSRNPPYYPQKTDGTNCSPNTIPFNTTVTAASMLQRFKCIPARSQEGVYSQALGKVYVVPGNANASGLHWKAQGSSASIFSSNVTIDGVQKTLKEWITIWINQGANP